VLEREFTLQTAGVDHEVLSELRYSLHIQRIEVAVNTFAPGNRDFGSRRSLLS